MIGRTFGSYQVTAKLGEGGMGAVYLAEHALLGKKAAVKVLLGEHAQRQDLIARFFTEAKAAASLNHPALIEVFDFGTAPDGVAFIVMEFLEGESLGHRLERLRVLSPEQTVDIARQVCSGVGAAHSKGIVHRDLKPDNIFLLPDPDGGTRERVKILDFGIAKLVGDGTSRGATSTGMVLGTPLFMAPEQCRGSGLVDLRADIYSLGCILMMMLCGRPPFLYEGVGEILAAHLTQEAPLVRTFNPNVPPALEAVVARALTKDPAARFATMAEMSAALAQAVNTGASSLPPTPKTEFLPAGATAALPPTTFSSVIGERKSLAAGATDVSPPRPAGGRGKLWLGLGGVAVVAAVAAAFVLGRRVGDEEGPARERGGANAGHAGVVAAADGDKRGNAGHEATGGVSAMGGPGAGGSPDTRPGEGAVALGGAGRSGEGAGGTLPVNAGRASTGGAPNAEAVPGGAGGSAGGSRPAGEQPRAEEGAPPPSSDRKKTGGGKGTAVGAKVSKDAAMAFASARVAATAGRDVQALEGFRAYLSLTSGTSPERLEAQRQVLELQRRLGEVEIVCDVQGATLSLDGRFAGTTPLRRSLVVVPGAHQLVVTKPGYKAATRQLTLRPGERQAVVFSLR